MHGIISSIVLFFIPYGAMHHVIDPFGKEAADFQSFGFAVATILVIVVNLQVKLEPELELLLFFLLLSRNFLLNICKLFFRNF